MRIPSLHLANIYITLHLTRCPWPTQRAAKRSPNTRRVLTLLASVHAVRELGNEPQLPQTPA